jgi:hypothetical protein
MTEEETIFVCVNLLTDEVVNFEAMAHAEMNSEPQPLAKPVRQSQSRGQTDDHNHANSP